MREGNTGRRRATGEGGRGENGERREEGGKLNQMIGHMKEEGGRDRVALRSGKEVGGGTDVVKWMEMAVCGALLGRARQMRGDLFGTSTCVQLVDDPDVDAPVGEVGAELAAAAAATNTCSVKLGRVAECWEDRLDALQQRLHDQASVARTGFKRSLQCLSLPCIVASFLPLPSLPLVLHCSPLHPRTRPRSHVSQWEAKQKAYEQAKKTNPEAQAPKVSARAQDTTTLRQPPLLRGTAIRRHSPRCVLASSSPPPPQKPHAVPVFRGERVMKPGEAVESVLARVSLAWEGEVLKSMRSRARADAESLPSCCFFTFVNTAHSLTSATVTQDALWLGGGFEDSSGESPRTPSDWAGALIIRLVRELPVAMPKHPHWRARVWPTAARAQPKGLEEDCSRGARRIAAETQGRNHASDLPLEGAIRRGLQAHARKWCTIGSMQHCEA